jgi:uncharacterized protein YjdB
MRKHIYCILAITLSLLSPQLLSAQVVDTGREIKKGELDFKAMAAYELIHPSPKVVQPVENDEDNDEQPTPLPVAPGKILKRRPMPPVPFSLLPVSPAPTDTFESTLDGGTNIPPDTHGAVDANYCLTTTNSFVKIQTKAGGAVSTTTLDLFWSPITGPGTFDPRVHYDPYTNRWIIVAVCDAKLSTSSILIAISKTSDPTGSWWMYKVLADATTINWLDFPDVGYNGKWITVSGNLFANSGGAYNGAKVYVFNKANLLSGGAATYTSFLHTSDFTICPALTYDAATANMFMVENYNGGNPGGGLMQLWKITGAVGSEAMASVGFPQAVGLNWQSTSFEAGGGPMVGTDFAPQAGTANLVQTNDNRVDQVVFMNNKLWFAHTVFLPYSTTVNPTRSAVQWWQIDTFGTPIQVGRIDDATNTNFYAFPTITPNANDDALVGFSAFSGTTFPSAAYAMHVHTDPVDSMRPLQVFRHGQASYYKIYSGTKNRWGDYSAACIDPVNLTDFWTIQEASASPANTWDTWWAHVKICSPPDVITGPANVCIGSAITVSDDSLGGTWSTVNTTVATIGSGTGVVTGISNGTASITYTVNGGCTAFKTITVNPLPGPITGSTTVCTGLTTPLSDAGGGTWASGTTTVATIGLASGIVTGVSPGTSVITYTLGTGCIKTTTVTVSAAPGAITGIATVCAGSTTALTDAGGGTWASSNTIVATVGLSSGNVSGISAGTATIVYTLGAGCTSSVTVTVNAAPASITGAASVCAGSSTSLTDSPGGGVWSSSNTSVATVVAGTVNGISPGTATISYILSGGCTATAVVTVNSMPSPITGATSVCQGATTPLSDAVSGGTWSSSNTTTASVSGSGLVTGLSAGTATISYTLGAVCTVTSNITINPSPAAITGATAVCAGLTTPLTDATSGGAWASSNTTIATVSGGGLVSGISPGTAVISYTLGGVCSATTTMSVNISAPAITGTRTICIGLTSALTDPSGGGTWTSSNTSVATVGTGSGIVFGVATGSATITYSLGAGCTATTSVTVNLAAAPITGTTTVCTGATTPLTDATGGGAWTSSNTSVATVVSGSGLVTGMSTGTATIVYTIGAGCSASTVVKVIPSPSAITGAGGVCLGAIAALSDAGGGTWSSSNTSIATVGISSGKVSGISTGTSVIVYTLSGCSATATETVNLLPAVFTVTGGGSYCAGGTGKDVSQSGSVTGINYELFNGLTLLLTLPGSSSSLDFGLQTLAGTYTVVAVDAVTGCSTNMVGSAVITITPLATPSVSITAVPGDTICTGGHVTFTPVPVFGGPAPTYQWTNNGVSVSSASSYTPLSTPGNGDIIVVTITSDYACLATPTAVSPPFIIHVQAPSLNLDTIKVTRLAIVIGQIDTFVVIAPHGGSAPVYQWILNGAAIAGATNATYITNTLANGDKVFCQVTSSDECATPTTNYSNVVKIQVSTGVNNIVPANSDLTLVPNPNKGEFTISGSLQNSNGREVKIIVTDLVGQTIYRKTAFPNNGNLNEHITLQSSIANGVYLVKIISGEEEPVVFRVAIDK